MKWKVLVAAALLMSGVAVSAHPAPFSYLDIVFRDGAIEGTLVVHVIDVAHDLHIQPADRLLDEDVVQREGERIGNLLQPRIQIRTIRRLTLRWESVELVKNDQAVRL